MQIPTFVRAAALALSLPVIQIGAQAGGGHLGTVHFETSCSGPAVAGFDRSMALLHSFEFGPAIRGFEAVAATDSTCAMAWWGVALATWTNPMVSNVRPAPLLARGQAAVERAMRAAERSPRATPRERAFVAAVGELYRDPASRDQRTRIVAYEQAMAALAAANPGDMEAQILHAISLVATALPTDTTYVNQLRAGAVLESLFVRQPDHPGLAHYIIHAYDAPALAPRATAAAARYAAIAPSASHALHMPSHTFTRTGDWRASAATNVRSMEVATRDGAIAEALHAMDYAVYADLQLGRDRAIDSLLARLPELRRRFDPEAVTGAAPGSAGLFALAAIPARLALERDDWKAAAAIVPTPTAYPFTDAVSWFARAMGRAHTKDLDAAIEAVDSLDAIERRLRAAKEANWADQVAINAAAARAWISFASGRAAQGQLAMVSAAMREDRTEKPAVSPGPLLPARELLGDMLSELGRPAEALEAYRLALVREPNRYRALRGAARAARAAGDGDTASKYDEMLAALRAP